MFGFLLLLYTCELDLDLEFLLWFEQFIEEGNQWIFFKEVA